MKRNKSNSQILAGANYGQYLALIYPINLLLRANSVDENLFAAFVLVGLYFF